MHLCGNFTHDAPVVLAWVLENAELLRAAVGRLWWRAP
jgi:hypothetical protein